MRSRITKPVFGFLLASLILSFGVSFLNPIMSMLLVNEKGLSPFYMGIFITMMTLLKIIVGHMSGVLGDQRNNRRSILLVSQWFTMIGLCGLIFMDNYWFLLCVVAPVLAIGGMGSSQLLGLGRLYSDSMVHSDTNHSTYLISWMRAAITVAWVIGPPAVFFIIVQWGFTWSLITAIGLSFLVWLSVHIYIPNFETHLQNTDSNHSAGAWLDNRPLLVVLFINAAVNVANNLYTISMPLYLTDTLHLEASWAGYLFGVAAGIEVLFALLTGYLVTRIGKERLVGISLLCGAIFYGALLALDTPLLLIVIQLFNAAFIGIATGLLLVIVQDKMTKQPALASTLYTNSMRVGSMLAGLIAGTVSEYFGYKAVFIISLGFTCIGIVLIKWLKQPVHLDNELSRSI